MILTEKQKKAKAYFDTLTDREKLKALHEISQPWIKKKAISQPAKTLEEIFELQNKSLNAISGLKADLSNGIIRDREEFVNQINKN